MTRCQPVLFLGTPTKGTESLRAGTKAPEELVATAASSENLMEPAKAYGLMHF